MYYLKKIALLLVVFISANGLSIAKEVPTIKYRSIVYFYPDTSIIKDEHISSQFKWFKIVDSLPDKTNAATISYSFINDFKDSYPVPDITHLAYFGRGIDNEQAARIQESNLALIVDVAYPSSISFDGLKQSAESLYLIAGTHNGLIWDSETRELFDPAVWKNKRIDSWDGDIPIVEDHTVIHAYKNDKGVRAITLGMAKFGLPDIVVNNFSWSLNRPVGNLINLTAQSITEGLIPDSDGVLTINIAGLKDSRYKRELMPTLKENAKPEVSIATGEAKWEEGDPDNYLIELLFHSAKGSSLSERQESLLSTLFGWEDEISYVKHNRQIEEASNRAREKLDGLRGAFNAGLDPGEFIQLKAPFSTPDGGAEWMWVEVLSWKGNDITGLLKNEPYHVPGLTGGSEVTVNQNDIFDYFHIFSDGRSEGNETGALIRKYQK